MPIVVALAPFFDLLVALAAMLMVYFLARFIIQGIADGLINVPAIGQSLHDALTGFADRLVQGAQYQVDSSVKSVTDVIDFVSGTVQWFFQQVTETAGYAIAGVQTITTLALSGIHALQVGAGVLGRNVAALASDAADLLTRVINLAARVEHVAAAVVPSLIAQAVAGVQTWALARLAELRSDFHAADVALGHAIDGAEADLQREITGVEAGIRDTIRADLGSLDHAAEVVRSELGVATGVSVAAIATAIATEVARLTRECIDPGCNYLGPQLDILNALGSALTIGAVAAGVTAAVHDPEGAAREAVQAWEGLRGIVNPVLSGIAGVTI